MGWWPRRGIFAPVLELVDGPLPDAPSPAPSHPQASIRPQLRTIAVEAVLRQDQAEQVLGRIRRRDAFGEIVRQAGPLVRRFFALRDELPGPCADAGDELIRAELDVILHHDAMVLALAQDLLAHEWRSERIARQVDTFDGLGPPARRLEELYRALTADPVQPAQLPR